jgi:hypothetical protein
LTKTGNATKSVVFHFISIVCVSLPQVTLNGKT